MGATRWGTLAYCSVPVSCGSVGSGRCAFWPLVGGVPSGGRFVGPMIMILRCPVRACVGPVGWCWIRGCWGGIGGRRWKRTVGHLFMAGFFCTRSLLPLGFSAISGSLGLGGVLLLLDFAVGCSSAFSSSRSLRLLYTFSTWDLS